MNSGIHAVQGAYSTIAFTSIDDTGVTISWPSHYRYTKTIAIYFDENFVQYAPGPNLGGNLPDGVRLYANGQGQRIPYKWKADNDIVGVMCRFSDNTWSSMTFFCKKFGRFAISNPAKASEVIKQWDLRTLYNKTPYVF